MVCFAYRWWFCRAFWFCCLVNTTNKKRRVLVVCFAYSWLFCKVFWFCYLVNTTDKSVWCNRLCSRFLPPFFFPNLVGCGWEGLLRVEVVWLLTINGSCMVLGFDKLVVSLSLCVFYFYFFYYFTLCYWKSCYVVGIVYIYQL